MKIITDIIRKTIDYCRGLLCLDPSRRKTRKLDAMIQQLCDSEEFFRRVFAQAPIGIAILNDFRTLTALNNEFIRITGRSTEELTAIDWQNITHPDDLSRETDLFEQFKAGLIEGYTIEKRYIKPDGSTIWINMTVAPLNEAEAKRGGKHLCLIEDITAKIKVTQELKESERSKSVLLLNLPGMAYRCNFDREWTMQFVSEGCFALTGYKAESLLGNRDLSYNKLIMPEHREIVWAEINQAIEQASAIKIEYPIITASGAIKWVYEQAQPIYDQAKKLESLEGLIIDITAHKTNEQEILHLTHHDFLTGLYNRRFFEKEKNRLDKQENLPLSVIVGDIDGLKLINDALGHELGDNIIKDTARILKECCGSCDVLARTGGDEFTILMPHTSRAEALAIYMIIQQEFIDEAKREKKPYMSISLGLNTKEKTTENLNWVIKVAEDNMYKHKLLEHKSSHSAIIGAMKSTMFNIIYETEAHANRLAEMARKIGVRLGLSRTEMDELELLATLHDIGKLGIDKSILNKAGPLDETEWVEMKKHTEIGYRIAMSSPELAPIAEYILCHHEHWNGAGYPQGRKGEKIPLLSRILAVIDAYDAMTEDRIYSKAISREAALDEIRRNAGTQFDPRIVEIFLGVMENGRTETEPSYDLFSNELKCSDSII